MADPTWTSPVALAALAAFASAVAAGAAAYNAFQQRRQAEEKLKLDLFDRRYRIYEATVRYIAHAIREANLSDEALRDLDRGSASIEFLFDKDVRDYVKSVRNRGIDLMTAHKLMEPLPISEERSKQASVIRDACIWFFDQLAHSEIVFAPSLKFQAPTA